MEIQPRDGDRKTREHFAHWPDERVMPTRFYLAARGKNGIHGRLGTAPSGDKEESRRSA